MILIHSDTKLLVKWYPEIKPLVEKYELELKLDQFGYGKLIFHKGEEIGYFFVPDNGIDLHLVEDYGTNVEHYDTWSEVLQRIEEVICQIEIEKQLNRIE